jgi:hypothetical protein
MWSELSNAVAADFLPAVALGRNRRVARSDRRSGYPPCDPENERGTIAIRRAMDQPEQRTADPQPLVRGKLVARRCGR